jgi:hypothetical protein
MEAAGVQMLPPDAGVAWIRRELLSSAYSGEVVVAGRLGMMATEYHPTGGLDVAALDVSAAGPMVGEVVADSVHDGLVVKTTLDPKQQPFLNDHRIDGIPVLPGVMGIESFVEVAKVLAPSLHVAGVENVTFAAPLKFYRDEPRTLTITALLRPEGDDLVADCRLSAERLLPGSDVPQVTVHFTGSVRLTDAAPEQQSHDVPQLEGASIGPDLVYRFYFHGPAYQVVGSAWRSNGAAVARFADDLPDNHVPDQPHTVAGPRLVELCFQAAGLWEAGTTGRLALPLHVDRLQLIGDPATATAPVFAVASPSDGDGFDCSVIDDSGRVLLRLEGYSTVSMPGALSDDVRGPLTDVMSDPA